MLMLINENRQTRSPGTSGEKYRLECDKLGSVSSFILFYFFYFISSISCQSAPSVLLIFRVIVHPMGKHGLRSGEGRGKRSMGLIHFFRSAIAVGDFVFQFERRRTSWNTLPKDLVKL